ncbi:unnamed protein product [Closterium sp. NIES-65]|nr:unnamed protein product [Closterium sp. NIES-65]
MHWYLAFFGFILALHSLPFFPLSPVATYPQLPVTRVVFPPSLTPKQRAALHGEGCTVRDVDDRRDMPGGSQRQLVLWREGGESEGEGRTLHVGADDGWQQEQQQPMGARQLGDALKQHLGWDVPADALGGDDRGGSGTEGKGVGGRGGGKRGSGEGGGRGGAGMGYGAAGVGRVRGGVAADVSDCSDVYEFVKRMRPLLDLEKFYSEEEAGMKGRHSKNSSRGGGSSGRPGFSAEKQYRVAGSTFPPLPLVRDDRFIEKQPEILPAAGSSGRSCAFATEATADVTPIPEPFKGWSLSAVKGFRDDYKSYLKAKAKLKKMKELNDKGEILHSIRTKAVEFQTKYATIKEKSAELVAATHLENQKRLQADFISSKEAEVEEILAASNSHVTVLATKLEEYILSLSADPELVVSDAAKERFRRLKGRCIEKVNSEIAAAKDEIVIRELDRQRKQAAEDLKKAAAAEELKEMDTELSMEEILKNHTKKMADQLRREITASVEAKLSKKFKKELSLGEQEPTTASNADSKAKKEKNDAPSKPRRKRGAKKPKTQNSNGDDGQQGKGANNNDKSSAKGPKNGGGGPGKGPRNKPRRVRNISFGVAQALRSIAADRSVVIKPADKNLGVTVLDREHYVRLCLDHLDDRSTYEPVFSNPTDSVFQQLRTLQVAWGPALPDSLWSDFLQRENSCQAFPVMALLEWVMLNSYVEFNGNVYRQIQGTAMGTPVAVCFAVLFMSRLDEVLKQRWTGTQPLRHVRYIDDGFIVWPGTRDELERYFNTFNSLDPNIKLTWHVSGQSVDFLDMVLYKGDRFAACVHTIPPHSNPSPLCLYPPHPQDAEVALAEEAASLASAQAKGRVLCHLHCSHSLLHPSSSPPLLPSPCAHPQDAEVALAEEAASTRSLASAQAKGRVLCHLHCSHSLLHPSSSPPLLPSPCAHPQDAEVALAEEAASTRSLASAQAKGRVLCHLRCTEATSGLMGKTLLTLVSNKTGKGASKGATADAGPAGSGSRASGPVLPPHKFTPHDVVAIRANKAEGAQAAIAQGVVYRVREDAVVVAVDDVPDGDGLDAPVRIEKLANDVTYKRMRDTLGALSRTGDVGVSTVGRPGAALIPVLFGQSEPRLAKAPPPFTPFNRALDESQKAAVAKSLSAHHVALIHGPPGTGKTTTVVEVVVQEVKRGSKVLVCAASNIAVDNLVERLVPHKQVRAVRVGHPARLLPSILNSSLDALVQQSDNSALAKDVRKEMQQLSGKLLKTRIRRERGEIQRDLRRLGKEERQRQQRAVEDVLKDSNVVLTTLTGCLSRHLEPLTFDLVVIDEAAQALEVSCWAAVLKAPRCILSGDHLQLPPTVQCDEAQKRGLGVTLFERLHRLYGDRITSMLTVQYRMHKDIMCWASDELYQSLLSAHASVASHGLPDLPGVVSGPVTEARLVLVDTTGCDDVEEQREEEGESLRNEGEARVVVAHVRRLLEAGVDAGDIGIVTPYSAQVGLLKSFREDSRQLARVEISTVDGFQGREKEAIIISMVRSNDTGEDSRYFLHPILRGMLVITAWNSVSMAPI